MDPSEQSSCRRRLWLTVAISPLFVLFLAVEFSIAVRATADGGRGWPGWTLVALCLIGGPIGAGLMVALPMWMLRRWRDRPGAIVVAVAAPGWVWGVVRMGSAAVESGSVTAAALEWSWLLVLLLGVGMIAGGVGRRVGSSRHCPRCDYEYSFVDEGAAPTRCPECAAVWAGRLRRGRRVRARWLIPVGAVVLILTPLVFAARLRGGGVARFMSDEALVAWVEVSPVVRDDQVWAELNARALSPQHASRVATRLLDLRLSEPRALGVRATRWMEDHVRTGTLPAAVDERFYSEMFRGRLDAPSRVRIGEPFEVGFRDADSADAIAYRCYVYIGGFGIGDDPAIAGRSDEGFLPRDLNRSASDPPGGSGAPVVRLTASRPGRTVVRADLWLVVQSGFPEPITWNHDGTPALPRAVRWFRRVTLEQELVVEP